MRPRLSNHHVITSILMSSQEASGAATGHRLLAAGAVLTSAVSFSVGPAIIHRTLSSSNPFYFNLIYTMVNTMLLAAFVVATRKIFAGFLFSNKSINLTNFALWFAYLRRRKQDAPAGEVIVTLSHLNLYSPISWVRAPMVWILMASFQFAFFAWATHFVETAVATTVYELWPAFVVYGIARHKNTDRLYRQETRDPTNSKYGVSREQMVLTGLAVLGLLFIMESQTGSSITSPLGLLSFSTILGMALALIAAFLGALRVVGSLHLGEVVFYQLVDGTPPFAKQTNKMNPGDRANQDPLSLLWITVLGLTIGNLAALPIILITGVGGSVASGDGISWLAVLGGVLLGGTVTLGEVLLRVGNISSNSPAINALFFVSPLLALTWLMLLDVSLPRFDLFVIGAALILAINILIQLKPDQERDHSRFGKASLPGTRLGFTAFIMSIWMFGVVIYLRDEFMPKSWLVWSTGEYWSLMALSATIFALILGFRLARLSNRIAKEDDTMMGLLRDCEHLVRSDVLDVGIIDTLTKLDTAQQGQLLSVYNSARSEIRDALRRADGIDPMLLSVEKQLDAVTHSKQQGRDIVELLSLVAFAAVTIGIGLFARPGPFDNVVSWEGFVSEVFILLFVSTIAFLCVNLFDIRREREIPLLVPIKQSQGDLGVFFRHQRNLVAARITAVLISVAMAATFCTLLYNKWL